MIYGIWLDKIIETNYEFSMKTNDLWNLQICISKVFKNCEKIKAFWEPFGLLQNAAYIEGWKSQFMSKLLSLLIAWLSAKIVTSTYRRILHKLTVEEIKEYLLNYLTLLSLDFYHSDQALKKRKHHQNDTKWYFYDCFLIL